MNKKVLILYITVGLIFLSGCEKVDDHHEAILGKWTKIENGVDDKHLTPVNNGDYIEFFPNGEYRAFYEPEGYFDRKSTYRMESNRLYINYEDTTNNFIYKYKFINKNKLKLTFIQGIIALSMHAPRVHIYKRIK